MKRRQVKRARAIEKAIRQTWDSLQSHLRYIYRNKLTRDETRKFHKKCVQKEYLPTMTTLINELCKLK